MNNLRFLYLAAVVVGCAVAQTASNPAWDNSGNGMLSGAYNFRHVAYLTTNLAGDTSRKVLTYGTMTFDGKGAYDLAATQLDSRGNAIAPVKVAYKGAYTLAASGYGFISNPIVKTAKIYGSVSSGVFLGASTESGFNDLLIAAPVPAAASYFTGTYHVAGMDVPSADHKEVRNYRFDWNPNGAGNFGPFAITGYAAGSASPLTDNVTGTYSPLDAGAGTIQVRGGSAAFLSGSQIYYLSPDASFVFGGSPLSFNIFVGVRGSQSPSDLREYSGLYFQAGLDHDASQILAKNQSVLSSYHGSVRAANGLAVNHQRLNALIYPNAMEYTFADNYSTQPNGTASDTFQQYWLGPGGKIRIGIGIYPFLGISVASKITTASQAGVYIDPTSLHNAASEAPFTAALSPGELVEISGGNLANGQARFTGAVAPTLLHGAQVLVNGKNAPIASVSPTKIRFLVPYETRSIASIQVVNNGAASNTVTAFVATTSPGLFTVPIGGTTSVAASHADNTPITRDNPAKVGETIQFYLVGLGAVTPAQADGAPGPVSPLARTAGKIQVYVDGQPAALTYVGLAPNYVGLYQINVVVPKDIRSGDVYVDVSGIDSDTSQAYLAIASGSGTKSSKSTAILGQKLQKHRWRSSGDRSDFPPSERTGNR